MPNWCDTTYKAVGTKEQVKKFYDLALSSWNKPKNDNQGWLGHLVTELGGNWEKVSCRGWIRDEPYYRDDFEDDYAECTLYTDCAWGEKDEWRHFIEKEIAYIFQELDWQCPETFINEMEWEEDWNEFIKQKGVTK